MTVTYFSKLELSTEQITTKLQIDKLTAIYTSGIKLEDLKSIGLTEMFTESKTNETKVTGVIGQNNNWITLDKEFNSAKSFALPPKFKGQYQSGDAIICTFVDKKIVNIERQNTKTRKQIGVVNEPEIKKNLIPEDGFWLSNEQQTMLNVAKSIYESNDDSNFAISLTGNAGYGKTSLAEKFAKLTNSKMLTINCATIPDNETWFVQPTFRQGETHFDLTVFSEYLQSGNCVILLDEGNRMPAWISNSLIPILDHQRFTHVRGLDIRVAPHVAFFITSNIGADYAGTNPVDKALQRRFVGQIEVGALPKDVEMELLQKRRGLDNKTARTIVSIFNRLRPALSEFSINVSTGTSLNVALWVKYQMTIRMAFELAVLNFASTEAKKIILETLKSEGV